MKTILNLILAIGILASGCSRTGSSVQQENSAALPVLKVGIQTSPAMTLIMVAERKGYFDSAGVDVELQEFTAGKFALQAFLGGSLDIAVSGEVPVALAALRGEQFRVIAQVVERTINECRVVVRSEAGLTTPEQYFGAKKRKLATSFGGGPEFYTYSFLKHYKIPASQVELISQKPEDMPGALVSQSVDAISIFDPQARQAEVLMGAAGMTFADSAIYSELYVASVRQQLIDERSDDLAAFIAGLLRAAAFIEAQPDEAKQIMMSYTKLDPLIVDGIWGNFVFKPAINDRFAAYCNDQAAWAIEKGDYKPDTKIPDYTGVLMPDLLRQLAPASVQLTPAE